MAAGGSGVPEQRSAGTARLSQLWARPRSDAPISQEVILTQRGFSLQLPKAKKKKNFFFIPFQQVLL